MWQMWFAWQCNEHSLMLIDNEGRERNSKVHLIIRFGSFLEYYILCTHTISKEKK
jgi:hypothetical protein